jgi:hypothetical protein
MGTYETALTRAFDKAQTKTIHSPTEDSYAWVLSMADPFAFVSRHRVIRLTPFLGLIDSKGYVEARPSAPRIPDLYDPIASDCDWTRDASRCRGMSGVF